MKNIQNFEVIIIGGSYAGLSAAMSLGRSLRDVLIIDSGFPCNQQTPYSHNFLTQDGKTPQEISTLARQQVEKYETIQFYKGVATSAIKQENGFIITTDKNNQFNAQKLIFATGIKDLMPNIEGFSECWGISVLHCPYCHGYEIRDKKTAIIANGERAFHLASLVHNLTNKVSIITRGKADFNSEQLARLDKFDIHIVEKELSAIEQKNGQLGNIIFEDGSKEIYEAAYASIPFTQHSDIPASLGCEFTEMGHIKVDDFQKTSVEGVYACGDNSARMRSVATAVYGGNIAGAMVNSLLVAL